MRRGVVEADGHEHMGGVERPRGACRARRGAHALHVEHHEQRFAFDIFDRDVDVAGQPVYRIAVEDGVGNLYVLVNYTALFSTRNILKRLEGEK